MNKSPRDWIAYHHPIPQARLRLFCFPYAGGSASVYRAWVQAFSPLVEICPVQLPGRERRLGEPHFRRLGPMVETLAQALNPFFEKPFAFFGHSMGALISFELIRFLRRAARPQPLHLFASGARAPQFPDPDPPIHHLPENEFFAELRRLNGTPEEALQHAELMHVLLPRLRADFEVCETYVYQPEEPFEIPITVFGGTHDKEVGPADLAGWCDQTRCACEMHMFSGDHFFIHSAREQVLRHVQQQLNAISFV